MSLDQLDRLRAGLADRYRLERELGQGGMATVYLAEDLKHHRKVAIKVLRPELAAVIGAERFIREIQTIAALQHPHILGLIDSGMASVEAQGSGVESSTTGTPSTLDPRPWTLAYYVMPFVEGESLRERLTREKQLPIPDAVRIGTEVASALDYAHRHGVVHRDIKPENVMLHDGQALVADFGIALAVTSAGATRLTETGLSLGTPHYMSPEQAMGEREITARSDVYALGCVTYEMLVGEPPFTGPTAQAIVARIMTSEVTPPSAFRKAVPPEVEQAVLTALEKLPADRFASAAAFSAALNGMSPARALPPRRGMPARTVSWSKPRLAAAGGIAVLAAGAAFVAGRRLGRSESPAVPSRLAIVAPTLGGTGFSAAIRQIAILPDGEGVVYVGQSNQNTLGLFLRRLDSPDPVEIPGTGGMYRPTVSPDGRWIVAGATSGGATRMQRLPITGGVAHPIPLPATIADDAWGPDGSYWFSDGSVAGISRVTPRDSVVPLPRGKTRGLRIQQVLDDGRTALVVRAPTGISSGPALLLDLVTAQTTPLLDGPVVEVRSVLGELLTVLPDGSIMATPFVRRSHRLGRQSVQLARGVAFSGAGVAQFAVAPSGTLAYIPETPRSLVLVDRSGRVETALTEQSNLHAPQFSPDGRRVSFDLTSPEGRDVWLVSMDDHAVTRATFDRDGHDATWSPDGKSLTYTSFKSGVLGVYRTRPGSTAPAESLLASNSVAYTGTWLADGRTLITDATDLAGHSSGDVARILDGGKGAVEPLAASPYLESYALPSPDGRWLAFVSDQSGRQEVYVQPLAGSGDQVQVSVSGGTEPVWGRDSRELFYRYLNEGQPVLGAATLRTTPDFAVTSRRVLFPIPEIVAAAPHANYDISPDGRRFVMVRRIPGSHIVVIQHLPALLKRLRGMSGGPRE